LRDRIAQLESAPVVTNPSFEEVDAQAARTIERDQLRAELGQRNC
jgi:hypothetical protein